MRALIIDLVIAALASACAQALIPEGEMKQSAEKLISFAVLAAVLAPAIELLIRFLKGGG